MSENEQVKETKKKRKKVDKSQVAIKIVALFLAIAMIVPIAISALYSIIGQK